jgi:arsenate reductase (thioredoxin)
MENKSVFNVLFLCTGNSARSILAEALMNRWGNGKFIAFSAGSQPKGNVHPFTIQVLAQMNFTTDWARSKNWDEFAKPDSPVMDFVFTVCDNAANETCPYWPGQPISAHWGLPDPAAATGTEAEQFQAFRETVRMLENRIKTFTSLRLEDLDRATLKTTVDKIGKTTD